MRRFFVFFLIALGVVLALGFWYWQNNIYSKETLKLEIVGPTEIQAGQEFEYAVKLKNNGKARLESPELTFQAPEKAILADSSSLRVVQKIDDIYPGEERTYLFKCRLFGEESELLEAKAWLSYQPKNLKARFESKTAFTTKIIFVPLTFEFDLPSKTEGSEEISFSLNYFSSMDYLLENLRIKIEYPAGFIFNSASPPPLDETEWVLPALNQGRGGKIEINGKINGGEGEEKIFKAKLGFLKDGQFFVLKKTQQAIRIAESSVHLSVLVNGESVYHAAAGELLHYEIFFKNIGDKPIQKKFLFVRLESDLFDLDTLKSNNGEFAKGDRTILWDWKNVSELRFLEAGQEGKVEFWVRLKEEAGAGVKNPAVRISANLQGIEKIFETKVSSGVILTQKLYYFKEPFENLSVFPPRVGEKTDLIVVWRVENTWNDLKNIKVKSILPAGVRPTGRFFPESAKFTFDSSSGMAMWNVGEMAAHQGATELAFQVEIEPVASQKGTCLKITGEANLTAEDNWTSEILEETAEGKDACQLDDREGGITE